MRILVVGAGAIGGYFGGRLLEAGRDVTFLVRPRRAELLAKHGLTIRSAFGDYHRDSPAIVPLLNGMRHLDALADRYGSKPLLGGQCVISATLDANGEIVQLGNLHALSFGELDGSRSRRI